MIVSNEFIKKIKDFGLNSYESKLWTALLSRGVSTAGELSDIANVPRSRAYDVLESLEKKGFIISKIGKPIKYLALPPAEVLERVKKKINEESALQIKNMEELKNSDVLTELTLLHTQGVDLVDPSQITGSFSGRNNLYDHLDLMVRTAEKSIILCTTEQGLLRKIDYFKKAFAKAAKKGVKIRICAPITKIHKKVISELKGIAELRHVKSFKGRFMIVDGESLMFMLLDDETVHPSYDTGVWVNTVLFSEALTSLFDIAWKSMEKVKL